VGVGVVLHLMLIGDSVALHCLIRFETGK
jgi:hypothetical protein